MSTTITIPNVQLSLDQLVAVVRHLESDDRAKVAQALLSDEMDMRLARLIDRLAAKPSTTPLTDEEINQEVWAVRRGRH
jgi:hypothetical protein